MFSVREWWDDVFRPDSTNDSEYLDDPDASTDKPLPPKRAKKQLLSFSPSKLIITIAWGIRGKLWQLFNV